VICRATPTSYGWLCSWNTTTVPDGNYTVVSYAANAAGGTASSGVALRVNNTDALPTTRVLIPSNGTTLSGSTYPDASGANATSVAFVLFGGSYGTSGRLLCTAGPTLYGWMCFWNTATVPDGTYTLKSVATNSAGTVFSSDVTITVKN
jgi:chitinase